MKKLLLLLPLLLCGMLNAQTLAPPIDFESSTIAYTFTNFDGGSASVINNPQVNGINTSAKVGEMVKNVGQVWGGSLLTMTNPIDFSVNKIFKMKVYSPRAGARVLLKVENLANGGIFFEKEDTSSVANAWEELTFDFSAINTSNSYQKIVLIWDLGTMGDGTSNFTFLFDDINLISGGGPVLQQIDLPVTFDDTMVDYTMTDFGGNVSVVTVDPTNPANMVSETTKGSGAQLWAGTTIGTANGFVNAVPFTATATTVSMRVWSPDANIPVRLKVEDKTNNTITCETETMTTQAGAWETMVFDFSNEVSGTPALNISNTFDLMSVFFNFGTDGATAGTKVYYFDDVYFGLPAAVLNQIDLPVTFDDTMVDYTMTDFGGNASVVTVDPTNPSNMVSETTKGNTAQLWAGTSIGTPNGFVNAVPFTATATTVSMRVWSPDANIPVRLKVEDKTNNTITCETETMTTQAGAWETLVFDFSNEVSGTPALNISNTFDLMSVFFNFGTDGATAGTKVYYFDDVYFGLPGAVLNQIDLPITFEDTMVDYTMTDFGGNFSMVVPDPTNPANNVSETTKDSTAQLWAGTTISTPMGLANAIPFTVTDTEISVRVWSPDAGIPVRLKAEDHTNNTISVETETMTTMAGAWETMVFDFSNEVSGTAAINVANTYDMLSIFFNFGTDGATAGQKTYYFDDVMFGLPTIPLNQIDLPITFDDTMVDYTMVDFGGNASMVVADPTNPANNVGQAIKDSTAQLWAGTTISTTMGLANAIPFSATDTEISVRVWSPDAGVPVRLKAEDHTNNTITVETEDTTTVAGAWETLVFDFSNEVSGTPALNTANTYDLLAIFFNFGTDGATAGTKTYYFDDVMMGVPVGITAAQIAGLRVYPNPVSQQVAIEAAMDMETIVVYDMTGREMLRHSPQAASTRIDLSQLKAGVYIVKINSETAQSNVRIIKQ